MNTPTATTPTPPANAAATQAEVIARLAREGVDRFSRMKATDDGPPFLVWQDRAFTNLEGAMAQPTRKRGHAELIDPASFAAYVNDHREEGTIITGVATETGAKFEALLDYHHANDGGVLGKTSWTEHRATLTLRPTPEWARWMGVNGRELDQRTFAEFLEDNAPDVIVPEGKPYPTQQELLSVASTLQIKTDVKFASSVRLQNGQVQLGYVENIEGGHGTEGKLPIPEKFGLALAPFIGTDKYLVTVRLRYRGAGGKASFRMEIERPHKIVESAFNDIRAKIETLTTLQPLVGTVTPQTRTLAV